MNTQNTPVHIRLWHREFWQMSIANWLLNMAAYMLIPVMPLWLLQTVGLTPLETGICMGISGLGFYSLGAFCSYLVQRFRRNQVCVLAIVLMAGCLVLLGSPSTINLSPLPSHLTPLVIMLLRFLFGAFFGLAQMVLSSTLIIDTSESFQRTEANHSSTWFSRFALALGPIAGLILYRLMDFEVVTWAAAGCCLAAIILIQLVRFPFRTPDDNVKKISLDRFFLPQGLWLFLNMLLVTLAVGMLMSTALTDWYYALMMAGFFLAILAQRFVFPEAELKSEILTGLILTGAALVIPTQQFLSPLFLGLGVGIIGARFLLFFIKLSRHCQRGTSQSMFMLSWETGLALGLFIGYSFLYQQPQTLCITALILIVVALLMYHFFTHRWYMTHKNR